MSNDAFVTALRVPALTRFYDPIVALTTRESTFKERLIEQAAPAPGERILDLGCGTGTLALLIKKRQPKSELSGLDADPEMLTRARAKAEASALEIHFDEGFADRLPYPDASFHKVVSTLFFHHLERGVKEKTAAELARVLRPGGELHVADWGRPTNALMRGLSLSIRLLDGFEPTRDNFSGALPSIFEQAGLTAVEQTGGMPTLFGTIAFYRGQRSGASA